MFGKEWTKLGSRIDIDFEFLNDKIEMHSHTKETDHLTIVLKGSIECSFSSKNDSVICNAGNIVDLEYPHEIKALENNTRIVNIIKGA